MKKRRKSRHITHGSGRSGGFCLKRRIESRDIRDKLQAIKREGTSSVAMRPGMLVIPNGARDGKDCLGRGGNFGNAGKDALEDLTENSPSCATQACQKPSEPSHRALSFGSARMSSREDYRPIGRRTLRRKISVCLNPFKPVCLGRDSRLC